jgi:hypothetical protein
MSAKIESMTDEAPQRLTIDQSINRSRSTSGSRALLITAADVT